MSLEGRDILQQTRMKYLEALRHREQEIFQYLAILVPALAGFGWLLHDNKVEGFEFYWVTVVVILVLLFGAWYSWVLGYNYRYIVFQLVKLEKLLGIQPAMLTSWQLSSPEKFLNPKFKHDPPEIIKVFWGAFLVMIFVVTLIAILKFYFMGTVFVMLQVVIFIIGSFCLIVGGWCIPWYFDEKLRNLYKNEKSEDWNLEIFLQH